MIGSLYRKWRERQSEFVDAYTWLISHVRPYRHYTWMIVLCGLVITFGEMAVPKFLQIIVDDLFPSGNEKALYYMAGIIAIIFVVTFFAQRMRTKWQIHLSENVFRDIQIATLRHIRGLGIAYFEKNAVGHTLSIMNVDLQRVQNLLRYTMPYLLQDLLLALVGLLLMSTISMKLVLCVIPAFVIYTLAGPFLSQKMLYYNRRLHTQRAVRDQKAYESVSALTELRANNAQQWDADRYAVIIDDMHRRWTIQQLWVRLRTMSSEFFYYLGTIVVIAVGVWMIRDGQLLIGEFVAFMFYYLIFIQTVARLFLAWADMELSMQQVRRVYSLMQEKAQIIESAHPQPLPAHAAIEIDQVQFAYEASKPILREVSLQIPYGAKVAFVGPTGNGKTTMLKLLARFYDPTKGEIRYGGVALQDLALDHLHEEVGYVFQESFMLGRTVRENIVIGCEGASDEEVMRAAQLAHIHEEIVKMPNGYDSLVGERGVKLSGGQRQRIALARIFLKRPSLLLLDEAMSALDSIHETRIQQSLEQVFSGHTIISVVHRISAIQQNYDQIVYFDQGQIAEVGTYAELISREGAFYQLITGQAAEEDADGYGEVG